MVNEKHIRIGNYIAASANKDSKDTWVIGKVKTILSSDVDFEQVECECEESFEWFFKDNYFGIPMDSDWHKKFGVEKDGFDSYRYKLPRKNNIDITIIFSGDYVMLMQGEEGKPRHDVDIISIWNKDLTRRDIYVHEFQNLYFLLAGEEIYDEEYQK